MTCSITQPFRVAPLPKISSLNNFSTQASHLQLSQTSPIQQFSNTFNIGISGSSLSQYVINPTPKLVFNHPIPSTNVVTACDVLTFEVTKQKEAVETTAPPKDTDENKEEIAGEDEDTSEAKDEEMEEAEATVGITKHEEETEEHELWAYALLANQKISTFNYFQRTKYNESEEIKAETIKLDSKVVNVKILSLEIAALVLENGFIQLYDLSEKKLISSTNTSYDNFYFTEFFQSSTNNKNYLFTLSKLSTKKDGIVCKMYDIDLNAKITKVVELQTTILDDFKPVADANKCFYNNGKFYQLVGSTIETYSLLPSFNKQQHTIDLSKIISSVADLPLVALKPIASNRCLLSFENKLYLLDLFHETVLVQRELSGNIKSFQVLQAGVLQNGQDNNTLALGVSTKHGSSQVSFLDIVNINVGDGSLKESLGKSFLKNSIKSSKKPHFQTLLKPLVFEKSVKLNQKIAEFSPDLNTIFEQLVSKTSDIEKFDNFFFTQLRIDASKGYYDESTDRFLNNAKFIEELCDCVMANFICKEQNPKVFTYMLTHPYFPQSKTTKLLSKLKFDSRLFKQCIVSCPALPIDELMEELFSVENDELLLELTLRILQDFNKEEIKNSIKVMSRLSIKNFIGFVLNYKSIKNNQDNNIVETMPQIIQLLALVLDSIGIFQLDLHTLKKLSKFLVKNIQIVETNNLLLNLLDNNSKFAANGSLGFSSNSAYNNKKKNSASEKLVPNYSVETLTY